MTLAKVKEQDGMTLAKVKEQDGMTLAIVKEQEWDDTCKSKTRPSEPRPTLKCQVSYISGLSSLARCVHLHLETERFYNIPYGQSSKVKTSSGRALKTYN